MQHASRSIRAEPLAGPCFLLRIPLLHEEDFMDGPTIDRDRVFAENEGAGRFETACQIIEVRVLMKLVVNVVRADFLACSEEDGHRTRRHRVEHKLPTCCMERRRQAVGVVQSVLMQRVQGYLMPQVLSFADGSQGGTCD